MIKTFISYDNARKENKAFIKDLINSSNGIHDFSLDYSIDLDNNESIRQKIRDEYITDATVLVLLATTDAKGRKFIDWEIAAAMYEGQKRKDGKTNDICGIVVVDYIKHNIRTSSQIVKNKYDSVYGNAGWVSLTSSEIKTKYDHLPQRIVESMARGASIQIIGSSDVGTLLLPAIEHAHETRIENSGKFFFNDLRKSNSPRKRMGLWS